MQKLTREVWKPMRDFCKCCGHPIEKVKLRFVGEKWVHVNRTMRGCGEQDKEHPEKKCHCNNAGAGR